MLDDIRRHSYCCNRRHSYCCNRRHNYCCNHRHSNRCYIRQRNHRHNHCCSLRSFHRNCLRILRHNDFQGRQGQRGRQNYLQPMQASQRCRRIASVYSPDHSRKLLVDHTARHNRPVARNLDKGPAPGSRKGRVNRRRGWLHLNVGHIQAEVFAFPILRRCPFRSHLASRILLVFVQANRLVNLQVPEQEECSCRRPRPRYHPGFLGLEHQNPRCPAASQKWNR